MRMTSLVAIITWAVAGLAAAEPEFRAEIIFPLQQKHVHSSSIVECPNGDFLACWFYGSGERSADDVMVQGARLRKGATEWSPVFVMADTPGFPDCNPVLFVDAQDRLWLFWITVLAHGWQHSLLKFRRAEDYMGDGPPKWSWQDVLLFDPGDAFAQAVKRGFDEIGREEGCWGEYAPPYQRMVEEAAKDPIKQQTGWMTRIHPTVLPLGRIVLPLYHDGFNLAAVALSDDVGESWHLSLPIVGFGPIQPTVARKKDGSLVAYLRDSGDAPQRVMISTSTDNGESWSVATDTDIPNPGSSLETIVLNDGHWVMVHNDTENGRHSLALAMSSNEGGTWPWKRHLERAEKTGGSFAYPSMIQATDGLIHITYSYNPGRDSGKSIKHAALHPDWIKRAQ